MTPILEIYRCALCETTVEVLEQCGVELICCGRHMELQKEQIHGVLRDMHMPIVEQVEGGIRVFVGPLPHEMKNRHHIEWVEVIADGECHRHFLEPGQPPEVTFHIQATEVVARAYCTVHGLWKSTAAILPAREAPHALAV